MSAADDYPLVRALDALNGGPSALDEIDQLRRWKAEALVSLNDWHGLDTLVPQVFACARLGQTWPTVIRDYIIELHARAVVAEVDADLLAHWARTYADSLADRIEAHDKAVASRPT